jgi:site-specific recombinase XerD
MDEIRVIKAWLKERARMKPDNSAFFISERFLSLSRKTAWVAIHRYGEKAGLALSAHPHMLRLPAVLLWPTKGLTRG